MSASPKDTPVRPLHEVITFYSYKGGTGRTMALANVACLLAREADAERPVLVVDWDLEAPGLHHYFHAGHRHRASPSGPGVVELFTHLADRLPQQSSATGEGETEGLADELIATLPFKDFVRPSGVPNLDVMPAGTIDPTYEARLGRLNWEDMYRRCPPIYRALARALVKKYSAVLIDSRTGMTDISGVCTALLPDKVVVVFTPNRQSLTGIEGLVRRATEYRQASTDLRPMMIYPLPSRIDGQFEQLRNLWRHGDEAQGVEGYQKQFERILSSAYALEKCDLSGYCDEVQIQHSPEYSFGEPIASLEAMSTDRLSIVRSYQALVGWLQASASPWERPETALDRKRLETLIEQDGVMSKAKTAGADRRLLSLREEIVALSRAARGPEHPETLVATERLINSLLDDPSEHLRAIELLDGVSRTIASQRVPQRWRTLELMLRSAGRLRVTGRPEDANRIADAALSSVRNVTPVGDDSALDGIAVRLLELACFREARSLLNVVIASRTKAFGEQGTETLRAMALLAKALGSEGDLPAALPIGEHVLQLRTAALGPEHPDTLASVGILADILRGRGDLSRARSLGEDLVEVRRRALGDEHPETLTAMNDLVETLIAQGDLEKAHATAERVVDARRRLAGEEHPSTLTAMSNLALALEEKGDLSAARDLEEKVLDVRRRTMGDEHPETLTAMNNLANTLREQGDLGRARQIELRVVETRRRVLGEQHPDTLAAVNNLATILVELGFLEEALTLQKQVLAAQLQISGEKHPATVTAINNLANVLRAQGDLATARTLQEQVWDAFRAGLGEEHPNTLTAMNNLAMTRWQQGDLSGARELEERVLEIRRRRFGERHPDTLASMNNLAGTLRAQNDVSGARDLYEKATEGLQLVLGKDHPHTLGLMANLAATLQDQGDLSGARRVLEEVLTRRRRLEAPDHPETLAVMNALAEVLLKEGRTEESRKLQEELIALQRRSPKISRL